MVSVYETFVSPASSSLRRLTESPLQGLSDTCGLAPACGRFAFETCQKGDDSNVKSPFQTGDAPLLPLWEVRPPLSGGTEGGQGLGDEG